MTPEQILKRVGPPPKPYQDAASQALEYINQVHPGAGMQQMADLVQAIMAGIMIAVSMTPQEMQEVLEYQRKIVMFEASDPDTPGHN